MSIEEFCEHWDDFIREPWGEARADLRAGIVAATIANVHRTRGQPFAPADFMPAAKEEPDESATRKQFADLQRQRRNNAKTRH